MQYLVTMEFVEPGPQFTPQQLAQLVEQTVLPGFDAFIELQAKGKIAAGGVLAGTRTVGLIVEAESNDELDQILHTIPFWGVMKTSAVPLQDFGRRAAQDRQLMEQIKSMV